MILPAIAHPLTDQQQIETISEMLEDLELDHWDELQFMAEATIDEIEYCQLNNVTYELIPNWQENGDSAMVAKENLRYPVVSIGALPYVMQQLGIDTSEKLTAVCGEANLIDATIGLARHAWSMNSSELRKFIDEQNDNFSGFLVDLAVGIFTEREAIK
jgi:hypothetical protein